MKRVVLIGCTIVVLSLSLGSPTHAAANPFLFQRTDTTAPAIALPNLITLFAHDTPETTLQHVFSLVVETLALVGGIVAFGYVLYGGYTYITSAGNPAQTDKGRDMIVGAIIGMLIIAVSYALVRYIIVEFLGAIR